MWSGILAAVVFAGGAGVAGPGSGPVRDTRIGDTAGDFFGFAAKSAGDVDGDGYGDLIVGAPMDRQEQGLAYVFYGAPEGSFALAPQVFAGEAPGDAFGWPVGSAGDIDGDGYDDIAVGAMVHSGSTTNAGRVYVFYGSATGIVPRSVEVRDGEGVLDGFGVAAIGAGDVNGDGYGDLLVGADAHDGRFEGSGKIYIYAGSATGLSARPIAVRDGYGGRFGEVGFGAGDINGDGFDDIVVGARAAAENGRTYVYYGAVTGLTGARVDVRTGAAANDNFGAAAAAAGDVDGDGYGDVVVGAPTHDGGGTDAGRVYLYFGSATGLARGRSLHVDGEFAGEVFGTAVGGAGDLNQDGYDDLLVGAPGYARHGERTGRVSLFLGSATGPVRPPAHVFDGAFAGDSWGSFVDRAGDVDGDGVGDVVVASPTSVPDGPAEPPVGRVEVWRRLFATFDRVDARQFRLDSTTPIAANAAVPNTHALHIGFAATTPPEWIEVELKPASQPFNGRGLVTAPTVVTAGAVDALTLARIEIPRPGSYRWRIRAINFGRDGAPWHRLQRHPWQSADIRLSTPPIVVARAQAGVTEGSTRAPVDFVVEVQTAATAPVDLWIDCDRDGVGGSAGDVTAGDRGSGVYRLTCPALDVRERNGPGWFGVTVGADRNGKTVATSIAYVEATNVAPQITALYTPQHLVEGARQFQIRVDAVDPGDHLAYDYDCAGDGVFELRDAGPTPTCRIRRNQGRVSPRVRVRDDVDATIASAEIEVRNVAPQIESITITGNPTEGDGGYFVNISANDANDTLRYRVDCDGDGVVDIRGLNDRVECRYSGLEQTVRNVFTEVADDRVSVSASATVTIANRAPRFVTQPVVAGASFLQGTPLRCSRWAVFDPVDPVTTAIRWLVNDTQVGTTSTTLAGGLDAGDRVRCRVRAFDDDGGVTAATSAEIQVIAGPKPPPPPPPSTSPVVRLAKMAAGTTGASVRRGAEGVVALRFAAATTTPKSDLREVTLAWTSTGDPVAAQPARLRIVADFDNSGDESPNDLELGAATVPATATAQTIKLEQSATMGAAPFFVVVDFAARTADAAPGAPLPWTLVLPGIVGLVGTGIGRRRGALLLLIASLSAGATLGGCAGRDDAASLELSLVAATITDEAGAPLAVDGLPIAADPLTIERGRR